jgi:hypothetical protein
LENEFVIHPQPKKTGFLKTEEFMDVIIESKQSKTDEGKEDDHDLKIDTVVAGNKDVGKFKKGEK